MVIMSAVDGCNKRKRDGRQSRVFQFSTFGLDFSDLGCFRENLRALMACGNQESMEMPTKFFQLKIRHHPPLQTLLLVIEEVVDTLLNPHCTLCQNVGWGDHMICNKKYHFVLPSNRTLDYLTKWEEEKQINLAKCLIVEAAHTMHGVFHSNGFGHLLCINGIEMGSDLSGTQIMDFWDQLCTSLHARKVSLYDISQKGGMEWRLLHGVAYGEPWFGRWGYKFEVGGSETMYRKAIQAIQTTPLHLIEYCNNHTSNIVIKYRTLSSPNRCLATLNDLFLFMLDLKSKITNSEPTSSSPNMNAASCRWSPKRVDMAARVIVDALRRAEFGWVSRQEVRDAARRYIGDTGLLDFVLKSLGNRVVGKFLVRRSLNPVTKVLEYSLVDISSIGFGSMTRGHNITRCQIVNDLFYFYKSILFGKQNQKRNVTSLTAIPVAARIILDAKLLIKEYFSEDHQQLPPTTEVENQENRLSSIYCTVRLRSKSQDDKELPMPPFERFVVVDHKTTIDDLKRDVEVRFRETYLGLKNLVVETNLKGSDMVVEVVGGEGGNEKVVFDGIGGDDLVYERGGDNGEEQVVNCICGGKDEGERLICCDVCEVWQHSRCAGIEDECEIPAMFLCTRCDQEIVNFSSLS